MKAAPLSTILAAALALAPGAAAGERVGTLPGAGLTVVGLPAVSAALPEEIEARRRAALSAAGDVNGDGIGDMVLGAGSADGLGGRRSGAAWVVFGGPGRRTVDVRALGAAGFRVDGPPPGLGVELDRSGPLGGGAGTAVAGLGDMNGDGLSDVAIGVPDASRADRPLAGAVYVVFGRASGEGVDLGALGNRGYRIDGPEEFGGFGTTVASAGDFNGDGRNDIVAGSKTGAHLVLTAATPADLDLAAPGAPTVELPQPQDKDPHEERDPPIVAGVGDLDGDGLSDVAIGIPGRVGRRGYAESGSATVIPGDRAPPKRIHLAKPGPAGFRITGNRLGDHVPGIGEVPNLTAAGSIGTALAGGADLNGDGRGDLLLGVPYAGAPGSFGPRLPTLGPRERVAVGAVYVVFGGSRRRVDLGRLGARGFVVRGGYIGERFGASVTLGDVDRDRRPELAIGAPGNDLGCRIDAGAVWVIPASVVRDGRAARVRAMAMIGHGWRELAGSQVAVAANRSRGGTFLASGPGDYILDGPWRAYAAAPASWSAPSRGCLRIAVRPQSLDHLARRRSVTVRITAPEADPEGEYLTLLVGDPRAKDPLRHYAWGHRNVYLRGAWRRSIRVPIDEWALRAVRRNPPRQLLVEARREGSERLDARIVVPLRRQRR